jgi:membrane protease YdiL (CAAX protease family)
MKFKLDSSPAKIKKIEEGEFSTVDILVLIWTTIKKLKDKASIILWSSFLLLLIWGFHGKMDILTNLFGEGWTQKITFNLPWGEQLVSFILGFILIVVIPCLIIKLRFKENIRNYGLGAVPSDQKQKAAVTFFTLLGVTLIFIVIASFDKSMQQEYPMFVQHDVNGNVTWTITCWWEFIIYEIIYLLFFITIEFAFRGYLMFGLHSIKINNNKDAKKGSLLRFGLYAVLIQMLAYTTWHYGKPVPEMIGTIIWGISVAAIALRLRSLWPIIIPHWLYNVILDTLIWTGLNDKIQKFFCGGGS